MALSKSIGFIEGQRSSVERLKKEFPDLAPDLQKASLQFKSAFGKAEEKITREMQGMLKEQYPKYISGLRKQTANHLDVQGLTYEIAQDYVSKIQARAKGDIPSPILETLLIYEYANNPSEEFAKNFTRKYNTKGHPKAEGLKLAISYPISWRPTEDGRANVVQKFTSENGNGIEYFNIMVKNLPLPKGRVISKRELDEFLTKSVLRTIVPPTGKFISAKSVTLNNHKAGVVLFDQTIPGLDVTMTLRMQMYAIIIRDKMVLLQFVVGVNDASKESLQKKFKKFDPLFSMIANSFIVHNQSLELD